VEIHPNPIQWSFLNPAAIRSDVSFLGHKIHEDPLYLIQLSPPFKNVDINEVSLCTETKKGLEKMKDTPFYHKK
jgi:hypothetical protein